MSVRVKICGITTVEDGQAAVAAGADAIGLNFVSGPRCITIERGEDFLRSLPPMCTAVLLIDVDKESRREPVLELARMRKVRHLQVYGDNAPQWVAPLTDQGFRILLPHQMQDGDARESIDNLLRRCESPPAALVLDAYHPQLAGGTGGTLDWDSLQGIGDSDPTLPPIVLAGGLTPENVTTAIVSARPYAVDVSSGVERQPGRKDANRVKRFVEAAKKAPGWEESDE